MSAGRDLIIVGAGPAGLAAAARAAEGGARVLLLDDQPAPGGQIWRGVGGAPGAGDDVLGAEYAAGRAALARLERAGVARAAGATVWQVTAEGEVGWSAEGRSRLVRAPFVLLATGAMERPMPVPGWTLPGVMTAGGAQTLLKSAALAAEGAVFAGCGPLLYLVVAQYLRAGVPVAAVLDTTAPAGRLDALAHLPGALLRADLLLKGQRWLGEIRRSGTRVIRGVTDLRILGTERAEGIAYQRDRGAWERIAAAHVFLHQGVVPNPNLAMAAGIAQVWDDTQLCWRPRTDRWGRSSALGLFVAGDGAGIDGAVAAEAKGELAALQILHGLGRLTASARDAAARPVFQRLAREQRARPFLDRWFRPAPQFRVPEAADTLVCRCEEITRGEIDRAIDTGLAGPNQLKSFTRAGMGPCQGRLCGLTVQELIARRTGRGPEAVGYYRLRPPITPLSLGELADLEIEEAAPADEGADLGAGAAPHG